MSKSFYFAYGLRVCSEVPIPGRQIVGGPVDLHIHYGTIPAHLPKASVSLPIIEAEGNSCIISVADVARYWVRDGAEIIIDRAADTTDDDVRVFLLGSAWWVLLQQREILALHASGIATDGGAVLFAGCSGIGKSTLLAALVDRGHRMLTDDLAAVSLDGSGRPMVQPGFPQIKLWPDAAARLGQSTAGLRRVRPGVEKYFVCPGSEFSWEATPLRRIYALASHNLSEIRFEPLSDSARFYVLSNQIRGRRALTNAQMQVNHFRLAGEVARVTAVVLVWRPQFPFLLDELVDRIDADLH